MVFKTANHVIIGDLILKFYVTPQFLRTFKNTLEIIVNLAIAMCMCLFKCLSQTFFKSYLLMKLILIDPQILSRGYVTGMKMNHFTQMRHKDLLVSNRHF